MPADYYQILGVEPAASQEAVKRAFRGLALRHHPDRNPGDARALAAFQRCAQAYAVLGDPQRRRIYDLYGPEWAEDPSFAPTAGLEEVFGSFDRLFEGLMSASPAEAGDGPDLHGELEISLEEAALGAGARLQLAFGQPCQLCRDGGRPPCPACAGRGRRPGARGGLVAVEEACPECRGLGSPPNPDCPLCRGRGRLTLQREVEVAVPAGVHSGQYLRLKGQGRPDASGRPRGDLFVKVLVRDHPLFSRRGWDLARRLEVSPEQAERRATVMVETLLDGVRPVELPAGASSGQSLVLAGLGLGRPDGGRGDLVLEIAVNGRPTPAEAPAGGDGPAGGRGPDLAANLRRLYHLPGGQGAVWLNQRIARTSYGGRAWDFRRLEDCLALMQAYLERRPDQALDPAQRSELVGLARELGERARGELPGRLRQGLLEVAAGLVSRAAQGPGSRGRSLASGGGRLPEVSYQSLAARARKSLADHILDQYVVGVFSLPKKAVLKNRFGRMLKELFAWVEGNYRLGEDRARFIDVCTTLFVSRNRTLFKSLVLNLSRRYQRQITLYEFESYLAAALTHFYRLLEMQHASHPGLVTDLPPGLASGADERRVWPRWPAEVPVEVVSGAPSRLSGQTKDVSRQGLRLLLEHPGRLVLGPELALELAPAPGKRLRLAGPVGWQRPPRPGGRGWEVGLGISQVSRPADYAAWLELLAAG
jgi:molecular chaperone DnaJ